MIPLLEALPESVEVGGAEYPVFTDFRDWIAFECMLLDESVPDEKKPFLALGWYQDTIPPDPVAATEAILGFYAGGPREETSSAPGSRSQQIIYDFQRDAEMIFASFWDAYGVDLTQADLHWWQFRAMLLYLPTRTRMAAVMGYRASEDKDLTPAQRKLKRLHDLGGRAKRSHATTEEEMIARARDARKRAEMARVSQLQKAGQVE